MQNSYYNQLSIFHAIISEGSITKAARKLEIAPPSVSQSLKALETRLGLPLFTRTTRKIEPTPAGLKLYKETVAAIAQLELAIEGVKDLTDSPAGTVKITMPKFVYQMLFKANYAEFCQRYPQILLELSITDANIDIIEQGIDMGIRFGDRIEPEMIARQLTPDTKEALFASPEYIRINGSPKQIKELEQHKLIQYRFITSNQLAVLKMKQQQESIAVDMPLALIANDTDAIIDSAQQGLGIGRMIEPLVNQHFNSGKLIPILKNHWHPYPGMYVYFHKNSQKAKRVRVLIDFLVEKSRGF